VELALTRFGSLDILINNAGRGMKYISEAFMTEPTRFWEADPKAWRMVIDTNINGPFLMARAAVRPMLRNRWGRIINISMNRDTMRRAGFSPYGPSKAAVESETIIWSQDLAGTGVTVNALLPGGATLTDMIPPGFPDHLRSTLLDPAIMVPPLLWLASSAADNITGKRVIANRWPSAVDQSASPEVALEDAG
jgi:3-oxoacyl-[acyl-carrier protein] reductase